MNPPDALVARLMRRYAPENYYIGANAVCFRTVRQVTLFGRCPLLMPTADFHNRYVLLLGIGAGAVVISGARRHVLDRGQALLVPPFTLHRYEALDGERHPLLFIGFEADMGDDAPDGVALHALANGTTPVSDGAWHVVDRIETAFDAAPALVPALTLLLLETLLLEVRNESPAAVSHPAWDRTQRVARLARIHPALGVPELARACGASESVLRDAVCSTTGMTLARFVRQLRLQNTLALVARKHLSAAAERAGYATIEAYSKAFKAEFGLAPSRFAHRALDNHWKVWPKPIPVD